LAVNFFLRMLGSSVLVAVCKWKKRQVKSELYGASEAMVT